MTQPDTAHEQATYVPIAKYTRSGDNAQCCPHAIAIGPGSCQYCWELHKAACAPCWERHLKAITQPHPNPPVQGRCPACGRNSLFLGEGGYVTCSRIECPHPEAPTELLEQPDVLLMTATLAKLTGGMAAVTALLDDHINSIKRASTIRRTGGS